MAGPTRPLPPARRHPRCGCCCCYCCCCYAAARYIAAAAETLGWCGFHTDRIASFDGAGAADVKGLECVRTCTRTPRTQQTPACECSLVMLILHVPAQSTAGWECAHEASSRRRVGQFYLASDCYRWWQWQSLSQRRSAESTGGRYSITVLIFTPEWSPGCACYIPLWA